MSYDIFLATGYWAGLFQWCPRRFRLVFWCDHIQDNCFKAEERRARRAE